MALRQLLNRSCNSPDAVFRTLRDFLAAADGIDDFRPGGDNPGPGYEIVDASYASGDPTNTTANDWCVLRSYGEAGSYPAYYKLQFGATQHGISCWLHWDAASHTGIVGNDRTTNIYHNGAGDVLLFVHADLDEIHIVIKPRGETRHYLSCHGRLKPDLLLYGGAAVQVAGNIAAGSGVEIPLPSWPGWAATGKKIYNWDVAGIHELIVASADAGAMTITAETAYDKAPGSWLAEDLFVFAFYNGTSALTGDSFGGVPPRQSGSVAHCYGLPLPTNDLTDGKYGDRLAADVWLGRADNVRGRLGLLRTTGADFSGQGVPWQDEGGRNWRLYAPYNSSRPIALLEAS